MTDPKEDLYQPRERKKLLSPEGNLIQFLTKAGQVIMLNIVWLLSCLPIITIGTATTSLYYSMMKNIRRDRGYPLVEYMASFKRTLGKGSIFTVCAGVWLFVLYHLRTVAIAQQGGTGGITGSICLMLMVVTAAILVYLFPVLSRFTMRMSDMVKLAFVMAVRYIGFTVTILIGTAVLIWIWFYFLPVPMILIWPGAWCYVCTFMIEKALRKYMPVSEADEDAWYYK